MAVIQALLAGLAQYAGKALNTAFGWATLMLFGKVPSRKQTLLSLVALGALLWMVTVVGIISPSAATFLLAFSKLPDRFAEKWGRIIMIGLAVVLPPIVGLLARYVASEEKLGAKDYVLGALKGYPYTFGLALSLIVTLFVAPVHKIRQLSKRWSSEHIPLVVEPDDYPEVIGQVKDALHEGGIDVERKKLNWFFALPAKILSLFGGKQAKRLVGDRLSLLAAPDLEVVLYPSDLVITGPEQKVTRAHAVLTDRLTVTKAHLTWDKESQELEDRLRRLVARAEQSRNGPSRELFDELYQIELALEKLHVAYEEWEVVYRQKLQAEALVVGGARGLERVREPRRRAA
jgi:hypothetical protein